MLFWLATDSQFKVGRLRRLMKKSTSSKMTRLNALRDRVRKLNLPGLKQSEGEDDDEDEDEHDASCVTWFCLWARARTHVIMVCLMASLSTSFDREHSKNNNAITLVVFVLAFREVSG